MSTTRRAPRYTVASGTPGQPANVHRHYMTLDRAKAFYDRCAEQGYQVRLWAARDEVEQRCIAAANLADVQPLVVRWWPLGVEEEQVHEYTDRKAALKVFRRQYRNGADVRVEHQDGERATTDPLPTRADDEARAKALATHHAPRSGGQA